MYLSGPELVLEVGGAQGRPCLRQEQGWGLGGGKKGKGQHSRHCSALARLAPSRRCSSCFPPLRNVAGCHAGPAVLETLRPLRR